jgi:hypothetical protein
MMHIGTSRFWSTSNLVEYLDTQRLSVAMSTISRWGQEGGPWGFPLPIQSTAASPLWQVDEVKSWVNTYSRVKHIQGHRLSELVKAYAANGAEIYRGFCAERNSITTATSTKATPTRQSLQPDDLSSILAAYRDLEKSWKVDYDYLVGESVNRLGDEPLLLPALTRLITIDHENVVNDLLAEVFKLLPKTLAFEVVGLTPERPNNNLPKRVEREWLVNRGHPGRTGRLDVAAIYSDHEWLVIESKMGSAEKADLVKQAGYFESFQSSSIPFKAAVLVADLGVGARGYGFKLIKWVDVLLNLRQGIANLGKSSKSQNQVALLLVLIGILERGLLGLRLDVRLSSQKTVDYLKDFHSRTPI